MILSTQLFDIVKPSIRNGVSLGGNDMKQKVMLSLMASILLAGVVGCSNTNSQSSNKKTNEKDQFISSVSQYLFSY